MSYEKIFDLVTKVDDFVWGPAMLVLLVGTGIFLTIRVGFLTWRNLGYAIKSTLSKEARTQKRGDGDVSPFSALTTALAATIGTGNIVGVATAMVSGGPGALVWMWISACFGLTSKFSECMLAIKYRERNEKGELLPDFVRLTSFGKKLRATSLDELPELFNILKGDMAIVGPRPLLVEYLPLYNEKQRKRHLVRPGITGYAQVNGRNSISWEEKFNLDISYMQNESFFLDVRIVIMTFFIVFSQDGINSDNDITMEDFRGTDNNKMRSEDE